MFIFYFYELFDKIILLSVMEGDKVAYYRAKKKNVGTKVFVWVLIIAMVASFAGSLLLYLLK